ncbi:alkaline phosphatase synthesis sensor protein PhoR [Gottschalkia acidurici 9a]|uniref:histidine kinase n=1 Tax=Gottschalkia acidurici (strain ATCC 7906 / DSM 604 / BCRC 14475 / CIP 104303 / KCTC 5404 / NCIMB 10678 / 9a) TaxID=1128398 RepID=K0B106_GOTA9|nr:HAMP domain-containing sensor histidine kinase [Gottschalkia acidurici]AFS78326.1 alkaline phosphatase synthesis sensor protein PhoR [Gottschalkia acidurici 9a]
MERRMLITFFILATIGILITGILSFSLFKIAVPTDFTSQVDKELLKYNLISIISGILVSLGLGTRFIRKVMEPVKKLTITTKKISTGNYGRRIYSKTDDELDELSENFNIMSEKLEETIGELQDNNTKMKAILTSMLNGVIALDNMNRIILMNPAAEEMFGVTEDIIKGKHIIEVIRNEELGEFVKGLIANNRSIDSEIEIYTPEYKILSFHSNLIRLGNDPNKIIGVVIILQDITDIRKLENMRKDFVANVSHELKTPLTSIKGFVETLKSGAAENPKIRDKFLDILDIEANRLTYLIQDLLTLSEIENKNTLKEDEKINIQDNIDQVLEMLEELAKKKGIEIVKNISDKLPDIYGDIGWFKQMIINLVDNGIKYTPENGIIKINAYNDKVNLYIEVSDTGIGIDKEHLPRLFERFYRVDKARTRQVGGTGLGLAIVKHIVLSFNGYVDVKSELNKGTKFTITIPLNKVTHK